MIYRRFALVVALGLLFTATTLYAQETYDPNAGPAVANAPTSGDALSSDSRLSSAISYTGKKVAVRDLVSELSEKSKVSLRAGINSSNWEVRDRKLNVFAKEAPLRDIMNSIARVTGFKWSIEGTKEVPVYRLVWDAKAQQEINELKEAIRISEEQEHLRKVEEGYSAIAKLDNLSQDDLAKLRAENPFLFYMAATGLSKNLNSFFNNSTDVMGALKSGSTYTTNVSSLNPAARQGLEGVVGQLKSVETKLRGRQPANNDIPNLGEATITVNPPVPELGRRGIMNRRLRMMGGGDALGSVVVRNGRDTTIIPLANPNNPMAKVIGNALIETDILNRPMRDVMRESMADARNAMGQAFSNIQTGGASNRTFTTVDGQIVFAEIPDEALDAKVDIDLTGTNLADIQERITEKTGITIVSDNYTGNYSREFQTAAMMMGVGIGAEEGATLRSVLDNVARRFQYQWNKPYAAVEFKDVEWLDKMEMLIPDAFLNNWKDTLTKTGTLGVVELAQLASLSQEQFRANVNSDEMLGKINLQASTGNFKEILGLFGILTNSQINAAFSRNGLNLKLLGGNTAAYVNSTWGRNRSLFENPDAPLMLNAGQILEGDKTLIEVSLSTREPNKEPIIWKIPQPKYTPPAE